MKPKRKAVDVDYLIALKPELPSNLFAMLLFLHTTGRRIGEAISLTPDDVREGVAHIQKTKNGEPAKATLVPVLVKMLEGLPAKHGRVFGYTDRHNIYSTLKRAWCSGWSRIPRDASSWTSFFCNCIGERRVV